MSKIILFGGTGMIGSRILQEAQSRGHEVTAVGRDSVNILRSSDVARVAVGQDVVISAFGPGGGNPDLLVDAAHSLLEGLQGSPARLIAVGGAGSLEVAPGLLLIDTPNFPAEWKELARSHAEALEVFRKSSGVKWTVAAPSALIEPGERTGKFRTDTEKLLVDEKGNSRISAEDFAVSVLDEVEQARFIGQRFTTGY